MPYYTVVIHTDNPRRFVPGSWTIEVPSRDPADILQAARELCEKEDVQLVRVVANANPNKEIT
jgi:hypothetical protein